MKTLERAVGNVSILLVSQVITWAATLVLTAALARQLGDARFGDLYLAMSFAIILGALVEFGLDQQLVRSVARNRTLASTYLINCLVMKAALSVVAYGIICVIVQILDYSGELRVTIGVYSVILFFNGVSASFTAVYQASQNVRYSALGTVLEKCVVCALALVLLHYGAGIVVMALIFVIGSAAGASIKGYFLRGILQFHGAIDIQLMRSLVIGAVPFILYWALGSVYYRIDVVLLSKLTEPAVVGWYAAAYKLFDTLVFLPSIVTAAVMYPILSRLAIESRTGLRMAVRKGLDIMIIVGVPICCGLLVLAEPIIQVIYGKPEYLNAVGALQLLAIALFLLYLNSVLASALVSLNQEKKMTIVAGLATVFNLGLNWAFIPYLQHIAAAGVTALTEGFILCYLIYVVPKDLVSRGSVIILLKTLVAGVMMGLVMALLRGESLVVAAAAGGLTYGLSGLALRVVPPEDIRLLREMMVARRARGLKVSET